MTQNDIDEETLRGIAAGLRDVLDGNLRSHEEVTGYVVSPEDIENGDFATLDDVAEELDDEEN